MTSVFADNKPDARQGDTEKLAPEHSLFRKRYRQLSADELALHDKIKDKADELANLIASIDTAASINKGANVTLALRHLEDSVYRAVKALTT